MMKTKRRTFLKMAGFASIGMNIPGFAAPISPIKTMMVNRKTSVGIIQDDISLIGPYGKWAVSHMQKDLPSLSFRRQESSDLSTWKKVAKARIIERMAIPDVGATPEVKVHKNYTFDGLSIEEISWQLPYGRPTEAIVLKPANSNGRLPAVLAFHDHAGNKYFGTRKITRNAEQHPMMREHQEHYYEGKAWANELARRGYVVMVSDAFPFASRRVMMSDVPQHLRRNLTDENPEDPANIRAYNSWASDHEHIMAKSLFSAGTTWPGVFFAEDRIALDILCSRNDVDATRVGCGGLSGGGMRTVFMGGLDPRIKCAVCVGFMTTWRDFALNKSYTHTWMTYVPVLPNELDFPEILALRAPLPTLVLNDEHDQLYTMPEMTRADDIVKMIYAKADAADKYKCSFFPGPHKFDAPMQKQAFEWFDQWLL